jgi:hypothetical protein
MKENTKLSPQEVCPENIWNYRQNYPRLVIRDIIEEFNLLDDPTAYKRIQNILMARGVNKWLKCRKDIIKLKQSWVTEINKLLKVQRNYKNILRDKEAVKKIKSRDVFNKEMHQNIAKIDIFRMCRKQVRKICHSERWVLERDIK